MLTDWQRFCLQIEDDMETSVQGESPADGALPDGVAPADSPPAAEGAVTPAADAGTQDSDDEVSRVQRRIDKLTRDRYEAAREAEYWRGVAEGRQKPKAEPQQLSRPSRAQFGDDEDGYQAALDDYIEQSVSSRVEKAAKDFEARQQQASRTQSFKQREADFQAKTPDYAEKVYSESLPITPAMAQLIAESENGPEVAYHLATHVSRAAEIAQMNPLAAARAIGRIEATIEAARNVPKPKPVSKAPPPPPKVDASEDEVSISPSDPDSDKLSSKEWLKKRERQIRNRK